MRRLVTLLVALALLTAPAVGFAAPDAMVEVGGLWTQVQKTWAVLRPLRERKASLEKSAAATARTIEVQKSKPEGVARDRALQEALARSKSTTDQIEQIQAELRWREPALAELSRRTVRAIDVVLDAKGPPLAAASRLSLERMRTSLVAELVSPTLPLAIVRDPNVPIDPLDGPRELRDKADLLRDSGDKLRREAQRLAGRIDGVERRRRLRERAGALDEDLFGENTSNRRIARASDSAGGGTIAATPSISTNGHGGATDTSTSSPSLPATNGSTGSLTPPVTTPTVATTQTVTSSNTTILRNLVDPATLDELRQSDSIDDADRQTRALKRAQGELEALAAELDRRAKALDGRADKLKQQK